MSHLQNNVSGYYLVFLFIILLWMCICICYYSIAKYNMKNITIIVPRRKIQPISTQTIDIV